MAETPRFHGIKNELRLTPIHRKNSKLGKAGYTDSNVIFSESHKNLTFS